MTWNSTSLKKLIAEVSSVPTPTLDWDAIEERVQAELQQEQPRVHRLYPFPERSGSGSRMLVVAAAFSALAAGVALFASSATHRASMPISRVAAHSATATEQQLVHPAKRWITTGANAVRVEFGERAFAQVLPHSKVVVEAEHPVIRLALASGRMHVKVLVHRNDDVLSVRVGRSVVSVHGTEFTVERRDGKMLVDLREGSVAVGEQGRHSVAERWLMHAPARGTFSLDGATSAEIVPTKPSEPATRDVSSKTTTISRSARPTPSFDRSSSSGSAVPGGSSRVDARERVIRSLRAEIRDCYDRLSFKPQAGVSIHASTDIQIKVAPDGHVRFARFNPPLNPRPQECASKAVQVAKFPPSSSEYGIRFQMKF